MYFFFVFFGYFKKRCYFCNRLAEMASKAMAKSCCVIRLIQVRVLQILREFRTNLFPVLVSLALDPYLGILCPIDSKKRIIGTERWQEYQNAKDVDYYEVLIPEREDSQHQFVIFTYPSVSISFKNMNLPTLKKADDN